MISLPGYSRRLVKFLGIAFLCLFFNISRAGSQEPAKIVDQSIKAAGGARALSKIQTLTIEGTFTADDGKTGTYTFVTKLPNRYYTELLLGEKPQIVA